MAERNITGGQVAAETVRRTFNLAVALGGTLWAVSRVTRLYGPTPGPRLRKGELSAGKATQKAEGVYWRAETAAADGRCKQARRDFQAAEKLRRHAKKRAKLGDRTSTDLRSAWRGARKQLRRCGSSSRA